LSKKPVQRQSQIITTFGPGAMIDLPTRSVLISGLDRWRMGSEATKAIDEPVMTRILEDWLRQQNRLPEGQRLRLLTPPVQPDGHHGEPFGIDVTVFPSWLVLDLVETPAIAGETRRARRLVRWHELNSASGWRKFETEDGKKHDVSPLRFVGACPNGHIQDLDWRRIVHGGEPCEADMWLIEQGTSANLTDLEIACGCGKRLSMREATLRGRLGDCEGQMPWLAGNPRERCEDESGQRIKLRLLTRSATNAYFSLTLTVISIPDDAGDHLEQMIRKHLSVLIKAKSADAIGLFRMANTGLDIDLQGYADTAIFERLADIAAATDQEAEANPRAREFDRLASGKLAIGENSATSWLYAETLPPTAWARADGSRPSIIENVVAVHRLREVMALYGFTRFEAPPSGADAELEDIQLAVRGASIGQDTDWLPAVEQSGEGVFLQISEPAMGSWLAREEVDARVATLQQGYGTHRDKYRAIADKGFPGGAYYLLHKLAHALMIEIALDCGYPQSALKERIYALPAGAGRAARFGILLYTVATGSQGTLGGLVGTARRVSTIYDNDLERLLICSNDPICADHHPGDAVDERALEGAACHGCLLVAETSCERRNNYLDRALLVETMAMNKASLGP
jgi:hypothetical protein